MPMGTRWIQTAYVSTFPPRRCGLATFTQDLAEAVDGYNCFAPSMVIAVSDGDARYDYDGRVIWEIQQDDVNSYRQAAQYVNRSAIDLVVLQHEFGIFGGNGGEYILEFLSRVQRPVITTLHSVLPNPDPYRKGLVNEICRLSSSVVTMAQKGRVILHETYQVPLSKLHVIHHGVPACEVRPREELKEKYGWRGRKILSTFGLLSSGKGIEYLITALSRVARHHPEILYLVLGQTHPVVARLEGERYREYLQDLVGRLSLQGKVMFVNRYLDREELLQYLLLTDIYVTPYLNPEQICSGTLAYALSLGKAIISTPYLYARELLADGRGILVGFRDPEGLAEAVDLLLSQPERQLELEGKARQYGARMLWPEVARHYLDLYRRWLPAIAGVSAGGGEEWLGVGAETSSLGVRR